MIYVDHLQVDHLDPNLPLREFCAGSVLLRIQPRKYVLLDHAGYTAPIRQHGARDHADLQNICPAWQIQIKWESIICPERCGIVGACSSGVSLRGSAKIRTKY